MSTPLFRFWSVAELGAQPPPEELVAGLVPVDGLGVLWAPSGHFKTFVALSIGLAVALDRSWLGRKVRGGPVVYIAAEGGRGIGSRVTAALDWLGAIDAPGFTVVPDTVYLHDGGHLAAYLSQLRTYTSKPIALTVIDTLSRCSAGSDENSNADRELTVDGLNHIRRATGGAVLAVHHTGWLEDRLRGGYALKAAADTILALKRNETGLELKVEKQRDGEDGATLNLAAQPHAGSLVITDGEGRPGALSVQQRKVLATLNEIALSDGVSATAWEKSCAVPASSFYAARKRLVIDQYVQQIGRGKYVITPAGLELLQSLQSHSNVSPIGGTFTPLPAPPFKGAGVGVRSPIEPGDAFEPEAA
jgi:hypothetical protein